MKVYLVITKREDVKRVLKTKNKYNLVSFEFLKKDNFLWTNDILLDSGAFTFLKKGLVNNLNDHMNKYINFIKENGINNFFELDLYDVIGIKETEKMRDKIEQKTGKSSIPVWHKSLGIEYYKELTKKYNYIAIGGFAIKTITKKDFKFITPLLKIAMDNNCNVHGLGFTSTIQLKKYPFYSVDSSTWDVYRFGELQRFDEKTKIIKRIKKPSENLRIKIEYRNELLNNNMLCWIKFQDYAERFL